MQSQTLKRLFLIMSPSVMLIVLAGLGLMGNPGYDEMTRATVAMVVLAYLVGVLATLWALQPFSRKSTSNAELAISPE